MSKWTKYYQAFIERFTRDLQTGEHQINKAVETTEAYLNATSDLTRDELALIISNVTWPSLRSHMKRARRRSKTGCST